MGRLIEPRSKEVAREHVGPIVQSLVLRRLFVGLRPEEQSPNH